MSPTIEKPKFDPDYRRYNTSFTYLMVSCTLFGIGAFSTYAKISELFSTTIADILIVICFVLIFGFSLAGLILGIRSFIKNENNHYKKWVGFFGNLCFVFLFFLGLLSNIFDFLDFMNS